MSIYFVKEKTVIIGELTISSINNKGEIIRIVNYIFRSCASCNKRENYE